MTCEDVTPEDPLPYCARCALAKTRMMGEWVCVCCDPRFQTGSKGDCRHKGPGA